MVASEATKERNSTLFNLIRRKTPKKQINHLNGELINTIQKYLDQYYIGTNNKKYQFKDNNKNVYKNEDEQLTDYDQGTIRYSISESPLESEDDNKPWNSPRNTEKITESLSDGQLELYNNLLRIIEKNKNLSKSERENLKQLSINAIKMNDPSNLPIKKSPTFSNEVKRLIAKKNMTPSDLRHNILMDRRLYSKLNKNPYYKPNKNTAIAICIGLHLTQDETNSLLNLAGFSLSPSVHYDMIIQFCINKEIYDLDIINELLYHFGHKCIGTDY